jgi:hypothetical protein
MVVNAENAIKQRLNIKYVDAKKLLQEAKENLGIEGPIGDREDEVIEEACEIFEDMEPEEQESMRNTGSAGGEPEWKRKALAAAAKREQQWQHNNPNTGNNEAGSLDSEERGKRMAQQAEADPVLEDQEDEGPVITTTTTTTVKKTVKKTANVTVSRVPMETTGKAVCCTIL